MTLVRERRHQQALRVSPPPTAADFTHRSLFPALSPASSTLDSPGIIDNLSDLEKVAVLGLGDGYGTVYKVRHKKSSSIYALKVLRFDNNAATSVLQQAAREAEILKLVDSPYVIRCNGVFDSGAFMSVDHNKEGGGDLCFMMEYMEGGSPHDVLRARQRLLENVISGMAKRVLKGLHYLHGMQIVHRDIKPSNLLIKSRGQVKIADFGVSHVVADAREVCDSYMGTYAYMRPERFDPAREVGRRQCRWFCRRCLVTWIGGVAMPHGPVSTGRTRAKTGLGDIDVCDMFWGEAGDAGDGLPGVAEFNLFGGVLRRTGGREQQLMSFFTTLL